MTPSSEIVWYVRMSKICLDPSKNNLIMYFLNRIFKLLNLKQAEDRHIFLQYLALL